MALAPTEGKTRTQRLFFALWPDNGVRDRLHAITADAMAGIAGRQVDRDNLHVTLIFLGSIDTGTRHCAEHAVDAVQGLPFTLRLDKLSYRARQHMLWLESSDLPRPLELLVDGFKVGLAACGFPLEERAYRPHITLARKVRKHVRAGELREPVNWQVDRFVLVESWTHPGGASYKVLRTWMLTDC